MRIDPTAIAGLALAIALPTFVNADDKCAPCAQARSQTTRLLAQPQTGPTPQGYPSGQYAGVPSCLGGTGPCWPSQYTGPCFPQIPPQWVNTPPSVNVTPQAQIPGANAPCMPCQNYPSFYCPPTLAPALPTIPLRTAGRVQLAKPVPYESLFASPQIVSTPQAQPQAVSSSEAEAVAPPAPPGPAVGGESEVRPEQP